MSRRHALIDAIRRSFWFLPSLSLVGGVLLGYGVPVLDEALRPDTFVIELNRLDAARSLLETIASVTVSVAGIAFSVTVVALTLASQQLGPRVLRTFQANRLAQATLAVFLGNFAYCLVVLTTLGTKGAGGIPEISLILAILGAAGGFGLFVAFIHDIVESLQASTLIRRMAADSHAAIDDPFPGGVCDEPADAAAAQREAGERRSAGRCVPVRAPRAGYVQRLDNEQFLEAAVRHDAFVVQRAPLGDFVLTGAALADMWIGEGSDAEPEDAAHDVASAFQLGDERTVVQDVAFPVRQLADVALRGLSPSLNDPTTAENAMDSLADTLARFARAERPSALRVDSDGRPRLLARPPDLDDLVRLGFDQVRVAAEGLPTMQVQLLALLEQVEQAARECGISTEETQRQARLIRDAAGDAEPTGADAERVRAGPG